MTHATVNHYAYLLNRRQQHSVGSVYTTEDAKIDEMVVDLLRSQDFMLGFPTSSDSTRRVPPMRKIMLAAALTLALGGCATIQEILDAGRFATASIANPVTPARLNEAEQALTVVFAAANAWKQACIKGVAEAHCRENIATAQAYTRRLPALLPKLRTFVRTNDQVNAILVYNQIKGLIDAFKSTAAASGVPVQGI